MLRQLWVIKIATIVVGVATVVIDSDNCEHCNNCDHITPPPYFLANNISNLGDPLGEIAVEGKVKILRKLQAHSFRSYVVG
mgnify:CR=1 FL=1